MSVFDYSVIFGSGCCVDEDAESVGEVVEDASEDAEASGCSGGVGV